MSISPIRAPEIDVDSEIAEMADFFLTNRKSDLNKIEINFKAKNFIEIAKVAHTIKGIARPYGFPTLENWARSLEEASRANDLTRLEGLIQQGRQLLG